MFKKKDILIILILFIATSAAIVFWAYNSERLTIGESKAIFDKENKTIFVALPEGSDTVQEISFNFPFKNDSIYIKKISSGHKSIDNPIEEKISNNSYFNFGDFISHSKLLIKSGDSNIEYDLWITTGEVPIISIYTEEDIPDEPKIDCKLTILTTEKVKTQHNIAAEIELIDISDSIPRNSYSLNIKEQAGTGNLPEILEFKNTKRFRLSNFYIDRSFIRERLSYEIFRSFSESNLAPNGIFVEVYENGSYRGLYNLYERVDRDMFSLPNYEPSDHVHSVIYEAVNWRADFTRGEEGFSQVEPDIENDGFYYDPLIELEEFIINSDRKDFFKNIENIVDMESLIDNHILFLLSGCTIENASNNYIYRGKDIDDKFRFNPGSLYMASFGIDDSLIKIDPETVSYPTMLFNRLYEDEDYRKKMSARWKDLRKEIITPEKIYALIDRDIYGLQDAVDRNFSGWPIKPELDEVNSFDQEMDYIKRFIKDRITWLDTYINFPTLIKIGDHYAKIDDDNNTIFCALPRDSDTVQEISWISSPNYEIYLEYLPVSSSIFGRYLAQKGKYNEYYDYRSLISGGSSNDNITIFLDRSSESKSDNGMLEIIGWAIDEESDQGPGVEQILLFDGPSLTRDNFLGTATLGLPRLDVSEYYNDTSLRDCGFEMYVSTFVLNNGTHELYLYAYDSNGDYTVRQIKVEIRNNEKVVNMLKKQEENIKQKLTNNNAYDFFEYIYHGKLTTVKDGFKKDYDLYVTTSDIPIINIYTEESEILNNDKIDSIMQIIFHDSSENNFIDGVQFDFYGRIGIEIRGKTSLNFPKKQYSFEIRDENGEDKDLSLLRMPSESDWILGAPYSDKTLMRNVLAFQISNEIGMYASRTKFVEVFIHSSNKDSIETDYLGVYYLAEKIKRDYNRVNVEKMNPGEVSGGYILEISPESKIEPGESVIETKRVLKLVNIYPGADSITTKQKNWITDYMDRFEQALYSHSFDDEELGYRKYIDVDSFIDYIIINELFKNAEAFRHSTFLYIEKDGKLKAGPVWDFNLSSGNTTEHVSIDNEPVSFFHISGGWKTRFFSDEYFVTKYINRWKQLREGQLSDANIIRLIDQNKESLSEAQVRNFKRWKILGKYVWPNPEPYAGSYEEEIEKLKNWLLTRAKWLDNSIDSAPYKSRTDK